MLQYLKMAFAVQRHCFYFTVSPLQAKPTCGSVNGRIDLALRRRNPNGDGRRWGQLVEEKSELTLGIDEWTSVIAPSYTRLQLRSTF